MTARDPASGPVGGGTKLTARHVTEYHEDYGDVLWWHDGEPPWVGSPLVTGHAVVVSVSTVMDTEKMLINVGGWPGYHEWWTPLPERPEIPAGRAALDTSAAESGEANHGRR